jgi:hypothetical protein
MSATAETLRLLTSIDRRLEQLLIALAPAQSNDTILSGPHGDPIVRAKDPKDWTGDSMKGKRFSECPPDYLEMVASRLDFFAAKNTDMEKQKWELLDARRARAWAARLRNGWKAPVTDRVDERETEPTW